MGVGGDGRLGGVVSVVMEVLLMFADAGDGLESSSVRRVRENVAASGELAGELLDRYRSNVFSWDELLLLSQVVVTGGWRAEAACQGMDVELFFPERGGDTKVAKEICGRCPVQGECAEYAWEAGEPHGIWGGVAARTRRGPKPKSVGCVTCGRRMAAKARLRTPLCSRECKLAHDRLRHAAHRLRQSGVA